MTARREPLSAVVLISGGGSNLQAFIDAVADGSLELDIRAVISNVADAFGLERAAQAGIPTAVLDHRDYPDRAAFDAALADTVDASNPDLVILAGFMRILTAEFVNRFEGRILNIHPSLLPKYPGLDTHRRALEAGDSEHGVTVHYVTAELDGGPRILQGRVPIREGDDAARLAARVLAVEHRIFPAAVRLIAAGRLTWEDGAAKLDGRTLREPLRFAADDGLRSSVT
ncbi:MAG: phosphoribosylglycinamide formyltransferase [Woeseiaceae bacterium]|nr:phosphoribosylglycinamide formyltransferase [Woeseiaceae bacterium]